MFSRSESWRELQYDPLNFIEKFEKIHGFRGSGAIVWAAGALVRRKLVLNNVSDLCRVLGALRGCLESKNHQKSISEQKDAFLAILVRL